MSRTVLFILLLFCTKLINAQEKDQKNTGTIESESAVYDDLGINQVTFSLTLEDAETGECVAAEVKVINVTQNQLISRFHQDTSQIAKSFELDLNRVYDFQLQASDYQDTTVRFDFTKIKVHKFDQTIKLQPRKSDLEIAIRDVDSEELLNLQGVVKNKNRNEQILLNPNEAKDGKYTIKVREDDEYEVEVKTSEGHIFYTRQSVIPKNLEEDRLEVDVKVIQELAPQTKIPLYNITFATRSAELNQQARSELDRVLEILEYYPQAVLQVSAHTDDTGEYDFNVKLSEQRAQVVFDYLIAGGFPANQLRTKGYGPNEPVASNETPEGRAKNRRFELLVISVE